MSIKIALAGNPNCGKTTLFNNLTGSNQYVGNWPGVTVEKKEGKLKGEKDVIIQDLPGIYSLSPYTLEEVVSRTYLVKEKPDAILNIIDGTNIERNLYLTTQLIELGIPVVMAVNMIDLVRKNGDTIDLKKLSKELGCQAVEISALKGEGTEAAAKAAIAAAKAGKASEELPHVFTGSVEHAIAHIEESIQGKVDDHFLRWYAVKLFERDDKVQDELKLDKSLLAHIDDHIKDCENEMDDDAESIITNQRYAYINTVVEKAVKKKARVEHLTVSDKIDQIVTNRVLALPIFALVMFLMYSLSMGTSIADGGWSIGTFATDWTNDVLFGEIVPNALGGFLEGIGVAGWLYGLIMDGIAALRWAAAHLSELQRVARTVLAGRGSFAPVRVYLVEMYFDTTRYSASALPAGRYQALRIDIGAAPYGRNWWCVLYPGLCRTACGGYAAPAENDLVCGRYLLRFKCVEWWQKHTARREDVILLG